MPLRWTVALIAVVAALLAPGVARAADLQANPSNLSSVFAAANGGDVIHLAAGSYGSFKGGAKPSMVTLRPQSGATASIGVSFSAASNIRLDGLTITGAVLEGATRNVTISNSRFTGITVIRTAQMANANVLLDSNTHFDIDADSYEGRITLPAHGPSASGVTISNSKFARGSSDGIQNGSNGTRIIGNEFYDIQQGDPSIAHSDPLQLYGSLNTVIRGNFIHDSASGIMAPDGSDHEVIEHNVIVRTGNSPIILGPDEGSIVRHNTLGGVLRVCTCNPGTPSSGTVVKDNIVNSLLIEGNTTLAEEDYNLIASGSSKGAYDLKGKPSFVGGASPALWESFTLAAGSLGKGKASDGSDMGADIATRTGPGPVPPVPGGAPPAAPPAPAPQAAAAGPALTLLRPSPGAVFRTRLRVRARASDASGIDHLELWIGRRARGSDAAAPYAWRPRFGRKQRSGTYTLSVRAFAKDGGVSSAAVKIRRRRHAARRSAGSPTPASVRWRVRSRSGAEGTLLRGRGAPRARVTAALAACADPRAAIVKRVRLQSGSKGLLRARVGRRGLCVVGLVSRR